MQNSLLSSLNLVKMDKLFNQDFSKPPDLKVGSNIPQALYNRSTGNHKNVPKELQIMAEEALIMKTHKESPCKLPDVPRSTFLMVFSPDGTKVASTHGNHNVYVTELTSKRNVRTLSGHPRTPWCIAFHPSSNQILASGCLGGQVRVWDLHGGSEIWMTESQTVIASLAFHPTDRLLVIASYNEVLFWDWSCPAPFAKSTTINEKEKVRFVGFDPLGHKLLTGVANAPPRIESQWNRTPAPPAPQPPPPPPDEPFQNDYERRIIVCYRFMVQQYEQLVHRYRLLIRARSGNSSIASSSVLGDSSLRRRTPPSPATPRTIRRFRSGALPTRYTQYQLARVRPGVLRLSERSRAPSVLSARVNRTGVMSSTVGQGSSRDSRNGDGTMLQQFESEITESLARLHRNIRRMRIHMPWDSDTRDSTRSTGSHPLALDTSDSEVDIETAPPPASPSSPHSARITIVPNPSGTSAWRQRDPFSESARSRLRQWQESVPSQVSPATDEAGPSNRDEEIAASGGIRNVDLRRIYLRVTGNSLAASFRDSNNTSTRSPGSSLSVSVVSNEAYEPRNDNPGPSHSEPMDQSETARSSLDQSESARSPLDQSETRASVVSVMGVARSEGRYFAEYPVSRMLDLADYLATNEDAIEPTGPFLRATTYSIRQFFGNMQTTYNVISSGNVNSPILDTLNFLYENYANNTSFQSIVQLARYLYQASIMCRARLLVLKAGQLERLWTMILRQLSRFSAYPSPSTSTSNSGNVASDPSNNASSGNNSNIGSTAGAGSSTRAQEAIQEFYQDINRNGRLLEVCFGALAEDSSQDYERNIFADSSPVTSYEDAADRMQRVLCRHLRWVSSRLDQWALPPFSASSTRHRLLDVASRDNVLRLALLGLDIMSPELSHVTNTAVVTVRNDFVDTLIQDMSLPITEDVLMSCIRRFASLSSRMDDVISREQTTLTPPTIQSPPTQTSPIASTSTAMFSEDESTLSESEVTGSHVRPTGPNTDRVDMCGITFGRLAGANANTRLDTGSAIRNIINRRSTNTSRINRRPSNIHRTDRSNIITLRLGRKNGLSLAAKTSRTSDRRDEARSSAPRMAGRNVTIRVNRSQSESRNRTSGVSNMGFTDLYPGWRDVTSPSGNNRPNNDNVVSSESTNNRFSDNATNRRSTDSNSISEPSESLNNGNTIPSDNLDHDNTIPTDNLNNRNPTSDNLNNRNPTSDNLNNINPRISDNLNISNPASDNLNNDNASSDNLNNGNPTTSDNLNNSNPRNSDNLNISNPRTSDNLNISNPASDNLNNGNPTTSDNLNNSNPIISDNLNISNPASDNLNNGNPNARSRATNSNASASRRLMRRARQTRARPVYRSAMSSSSDDDETPLIDDSDLDDDDDNAPSTSRPRTSSTSDLLRRLKALARTTSSESTPDRRPVDPNPPSTSSAQSPLSSESSSFSNIMQSVRELVTQLETLVDLDRHSLSRSRTSDVSPSHSLSRTSDVSPSRSRSRTSDISPSHSRSRTSDVSPSHSRSRTSDVSPSHSRSRTSDVSFSHSRSRPSLVSPSLLHSRNTEVSPSLLHSRNTEVSPSLSHSRNTDVSPSSSTTSTPTSSSSSSLTSTPDGTSASRSLFSTPLSAFVSGLRRKRKQSPVSSEPESQRRHIALEPSTHDQEQASSSTQPDGCSCWYQTNDNTSDPNTPNSSLNISQLNASQPPEIQAEVRPADSTISDNAPNLGEEGQSHSGRCIVSSTQSNTHTYSQSNARQASPDSNVTSEPHVTSEAQTLAQSLLEGSSETIAILDDVLDTVIEASERDGVPPLPQGATNERVSITSAPPTAPPSSNTWENVRFLRVPRARPWESWTCPSRRASSPSRIGGVEMLRVPSSWSLAPVEGSHNSEHSNSPGRRSLDQGNASVRNNSSSQTVGSTNNSSVQTGNSNNNSGGGLYLLSGLLRPEVMGGALGGADESQPGDTSTFSFLGRNRDRSPLQYWRSPVDMETEATPADEEVVITSARERRSDGSPNREREREDSRVQRLVTSFWDNSIRYERLDSNPPTPSQESSTSRDGPNRLSDNPRFRSGDFQWSFMRDRDTESCATPRREEPSTEPSPFFPELSHRIQNLYQILNRQETTRDSPLQNPLNRARDSSQNPLSSSEANDRARSRSSATASNSRTTPLSASIGRSSSLNSSLGRPSLNSATRSSLNSSSLNSPTRSSLNSSNRSFNISIGARSALNSSVGARSSLNSSAGARSSLNAARNPLERRRMSERNATLVHERRLLTERRNLLLSERRSLTAERLRLTATNLERQRERQRMSALHRTMPGSSRTGVFRDFRTWMRRPTNDTASSSALDQAHVDSRTKLKLMNIAARNRLKRERTAAQTASGTTSQPSTSRTPPGPPPASTLPTSTTRTRTSRNISGQADSDRHRMVKARSQARHILAMMLRHISSFFQNANLLDVPSHQDPQESFFFHERVYNLHRLLQLALHLTELLYAQLSRSRHLLDNLRSSLNSVTRLQSLLRHRQLSSRLLQVPSFRPSRGPIRLSRESSVPLSVLSGSVPTGSTQPEAPPPPPNTTDNPRQNTRESPIDSLRRDLFPSQQSSANPQSPDLSSIPSSSTPRFLHPRHHVTPPAAWDEVAGEEPERGGALGSNVFLMRGAYGPNSILVPDSYYSPHHRIQAWDFARNNIPDIWNAQKNIVVKECKIHNDASVDISKDGQILVTLLPSGRLSVTTMLGVYSLHWNSLGQCLYTTSFELNAVSVSLSPTSRHLIVGLASRRVSLSSFADTHTIAQIFRLEGGVPGSDASNGSGDGKGVPGGKKGRLVQLRHIELPRDTGYMSLNCIRWTPTPGQGLVYGTNTGLLRILE